MSLTRRERIMRIHKGKEIDRPALKLWGLNPVRRKYDPVYSPGQDLSPMYDPVTKLALETTDIFAQMGAKFHPFYGQLENENTYQFDEPCDIPGWRLVRSVYKTPLGDLTSLKRVSTTGEPGYVIEHLVKDAADVRKLLSTPYEPYPYDHTEYCDIDSVVGDRGITVLGLPHPGSQLASVCGSETFAFLCMDEPGLIEEAINLYAQRVWDLLNDIVSQKVKAVYGIIGPEILTPPLLNMEGFLKYVVEPNRRIYDRIHDSGGYVWMHCHGKVAKLLDSFIEMGVDVLNPLEPPKNGDINMAETVKKYGGRIGLEGNIEIQDILLAPFEKLRALMEECVAAAAPAGRFILCPSAGYEEYVNPSEHYIKNLMLYLTYGLELVEKAG